MSVNASRLRYPLARFFDDLDEPGQSLGDGVGQIVLDKGQDVLEVHLEGSDEGALRGDAGAQRASHPGAQEVLCRRPVSVSPEEGKLVLEDPGAVNTAVGMTQTIDGSVCPLVRVAGCL